MGDEPRQGRLSRLVLFLDENHCRNPHIIAAIEQYGASCEKHLDHFAAGTEDVDWLPIVGQRGWSLLTSDARIRKNLIEREAVRLSGIGMFYFSRNQISGADMGAALRKALPTMDYLVKTTEPPFTASINRRGEVALRDTFK